MTISAKRFKFLDQETNVAVADFLNPGDNAIFNSPNLEALEMDVDMQEFLEQSFGSPEIILEAGESATDDLIRQTKDAFGSLKNIAGLSQAQIDRAVLDMFPGNAKAQAAYKQLAGKCRTGPMGRYNAGRPYNPSINCNGKNKRGKSGGCSPSGISNVLDSLTGGDYSSKTRNLNQALSNLVALATTGYNANLCGVFSALSGGLNLDKYVSSRGAGMLLGSLGLGKNLRGVFDLAGASATADLHVLRENPGGITGVLNNLQLPFDSRHRDMLELDEGITESMSAFDAGWKTSVFDGSFSTEKITQYSGDLDDILSSKSVNRTVDADLDFIPEDDSSFMRMGLNATAGANPFGGFFG